LETAETSPQQRIDALYWAAFARPPTTAEVSAVLDFLKSQAAELGLRDDAWPSAVEVWADLCHVVWNSKEFVYRR
jgi:hypothetical protein